MAKKWQDMSIKDKIAIISACIAFILGWGLTIAGFIIGAGTITDSVLWVLGQALIYAGSIFGIGMYMGSSVKGMRAEIHNFMKNPKDNLEEED